jgi:EcoEI R protein C-terminal
MFEQTFKNIDADLRNEAGCTTEHDYTEQTSWLLSLKHLDGLEQDKAMEAELEGKKYTFILNKPYRWSTWAAPKDIIGNSDHNKAQTGDDLRDFVDRKLFPNVAYALPPLTREGRAAKAKVIISTHFNTRQQVFLNFVLSHYLSEGVEELDPIKLSPLLKLRYHDSIADAVADLGKPDEIGRVFSGFQRYLYNAVA